MSSADRGNTGHISDAEAATVIYAPGLDPALEARIRSHVADCRDCAIRLQALREADRSAGALLSYLDVASPAPSARDIVRAAQAPKWRVFIARQRIAAAIIAFLVIATAAAAAIPASPLHRLIVRALSGGKVAHGTAGVKAQSAPAASAGVSLIAASSIDVVFDGRGMGGLVHLRIVDGDQLSLSSPDSGVTLRVSSNRISVNQTGPSTYQLDIPRSLRGLRVLIGGQVVFDRRLHEPMSTDTLTIHLVAR